MRNNPKSGDMAERLLEASGRAYGLKLPLNASTARSGPGSEARIEQGGLSC